MFFGRVVCDWNNSSASGISISRNSKLLKSVAKLKSKLNIAFNLQPSNSKMENKFSQLKFFARSKGDYYVEILVITLLLASLAFPFMDF